MSYRLRFKSYRLPLRTPLRTAHGPWTEREGVLVRLEDAEGRTGHGEAAPIPWFGTETPAEILATLTDLGDSFEAGQLGEIPPRLACLRFALAGALRAVSLATNAVTTGSRLPVAALLPAGRAALLALDGALETGFLAFKWKVGVGRAEEELPILDDLLARLPDFARLRLDANGAWDRRTAERWLARCAERPVEFVEQPAAPGQDDLLLGLAGDFPVTLALDESVTGLAALQRWHDRGWPGVYVVKPALAGPLPELTAWIRGAKADVVCSSAIETALGRAAILDWIFAENVTRRALGFGIGGVFGDARWDGPVVGPLLDAGWARAVNAGELWNALT